MEHGVVWSGEVNVNDSWQQLSLEVTAGASGKVTVFVSSQFRNAMPLAHMDTWWDEASLVVISPPTATPAPTQVPPTAAPTSSAPVATPTPRPDGAVVHVVESGDTLFGIALEYNVDVEELRRLNAGTLGENDMLSIGQEVVISAASAAAPTPTPEPTQAAACRSGHPWHDSPSGDTTAGAG
jgi:LysM repeat protein